MERVIARLDIIDKHLNKIDQTLILNTEQLRLHIEGVRLAREQNEILRQELNVRIDFNERNIDDVLAHTHRVDGGFRTLGFVMKIVTASAAAIGTVIAIAKLLEFLKT